MQGDQCLDAPCFHTKVNAHIDREVAAHPELIQIENGYRNPKEQRPGAVRSGTYRAIDTANQNPDAKPVAACEAAKPAIIVYGKRVGTTLTICTDNDCPVHDPRAAAKAAQREAEHPAPVMAPAPPAETEEEAATRKQQHEEQRKAYEAEEERRAEERRKQQEREEQEREAEFAKRDKLRKKREATFERIVQEAPPTFTAPQLRVILRALVNLDPYTFADDLAEDMSDENEKRSAEEVLLALIEGTGDDKLTSFAVRLALAGHRGIPREGELDFLADAEAEAVFLTSKPKKAAAKKAGTKKAPAQKQPTPIKPAKTKKPAPAPEHAAAA